MTKTNDGEKFTSSILPKGILVAVGGNEDKEQDLYVLRRITDLIKKNPIAIEVITTASEIPEDLGDMYLKAFAKIGNTAVGVMHIQTRSQADQPEYLERIRAADLIFFTGGDQLRITSVLGGTVFLKSIIKKYYQENCIIAGTSAGATAMSRTMIYDGESSEALLKGSVKVTAGIGLVENVIIDSHFIKRGRFSRLMEIIAANPGYIGVGLGEDTGVIIRQGHLLETIGNNLVVIIEGKHIQHTNITSIKYGEAIAVENIHLHTLVNGYGYDLLEETFLRPAELQALLAS